LFVGQFDVMIPFFSPAFQNHELARHLSGFRCTPASCVYNRPGTSHPITYQEDKSNQDFAQIPEKLAWHIAKYVDMIQKSRNVDLKRPIPLSAELELEFNKMMEDLRSS
jgi:hypothetical protein